MAYAYYCQCGSHFRAKHELREHIGIYNPHWPKTSPQDEHHEVAFDKWKQLCKDNA